MASTNFVYQDAIDQVRKLLDDDAARRLTDDDINNLYVPRILMQLRADRPDVFLGGLSTFNPKPGITYACAFDDVAFNDFVEALLAAINGAMEETVSTGQAGMADARSERARRGR